MSIELPEVRILAGQMDKELRGKTIKSCRVRDYEKLQKIGFVNRDIRAFDQLVSRRIESVVSRGNVIRMKMDGRMNLVLSPEYGGVILYHPDEGKASEKFHLRLDFEDGTALTTRLTGMGVIHALKDSELEKSYVYARDFSDVPSPIDEKEFTFQRFSDSLAGKNVGLKAAIVGKDAVVVGLGNSAFQDIAFRAGIHPKRKVSDLSKDEGRALFDAIRFVVRERVRLGGKEGFVDLYDKEGRYAPAMGPNIKTSCTSCGTRVEKVAVGGGQAYFCPKCQR